MSSNFSSIPILDYSLIAAGKKEDFLNQLRHALVNVGFLYLDNPPVERHVLEAVIDYCPKLFDIPQAEKDDLKMSNSPHFLGYSKRGDERTKGRIDQREQFDFATPYHCQWKEGDPEYKKLWGDAQWPREEAIPGFKDTMLKYLNQVQAMSFEFTSLLAEAFGLPPTGLAEFYDNPDAMQHWAKIVKYPTRNQTDSDQGVGPHFDSGFLTFLLQASDHPGLQVQNLSGQWIDAPPIPGTFVVNIGKGLETVTQNLAKATSHRVLSPEGSTPRFSIPFFQNIKQSVKLTEHILKISPELLKLKEQRGDVEEPDSVNFAEYGEEPSGQVSLIGRVLSHPEVAKRHYPQLFERYFPQGISAR